MLSARLCWPFTVTETRAATIMASLITGNFFPLQSFHSHEKSFCCKKTKTVFILVRGQICPEFTLSGLMWFLSLHQTFRRKILSVLLPGSVVSSKSCKILFILCSTDEQDLTKHIITVSVVGLAPPTFEHSEQSLCPSIFHPPATVVVDGAQPQPYWLHRLGVKSTVVNEYGYLKSRPNKKEKYYALNQHKFVKLLQSDMGTSTRKYEPCLRPHRPRGSHCSEVTKGY